MHMSFQSFFLSQVNITRTRCMRRPHDPSLQAAISTETESADSRALREKPQERLGQTSVSRLSDWLSQSRTNRTFWVKGDAAPRACVLAGSTDSRTTQHMQCDGCDGETERLHFLTSSYLNSCMRFGSAPLEFPKGWRMAEVPKRLMSFFSFSLFVSGIHKTLPGRSALPLSLSFSVY